jgi:hypothetical protein
LSNYAADPVRPPNRMTIYFSQDVEQALQELTYVLKVFAINTACDFTLVQGDMSPRAGTSADSALRISTAFINRTINAADLGPEGYFVFEDGQRDVVSTAFFYLACLQEVDASNNDKLNRFRFAGSVQEKFGTATTNIVQRCFDEIARRLATRPSPRKSAFFLSHDIDSVYGSIKEDGFNVIKKGRFDIFLKMLFDVAVSKPAWLNIDKILKIESEYDCKSTFYWIVNHGRVGKGEENADYQITDRRIRQSIQHVRDAGFENSIHKSLAAESFQSEISKLGFDPIGNRFHYLKFSIPAGYEAVEEAGLKLDASLGFSEQWGFRNNYGLPYNPYHPTRRQPFGFVECPLHIMDRTFFARRMDIKSAETEIFSFFEANRTNAVLSVLWHNNFFSDYKYKGYLSLYKKILGYIRDSNFQTLSQKDIIKNYSLTWPS